MFQFEGGPRYPTGPMMIALILLAALGLWLANHLQHPPVIALVALGIGMLGGILMASAFTPVGLCPPQGGFFNRLRWFFIPGAGTAVELNQPMLYIGLLLVFAAQVIDVVAE